VFKLVLNKKKDYTSGEVGEIRHKETDRYVCRVESWAFTSCGIGALTKLNSTNFTSAEEVQAFFDFVCTNVADDWHPNEFYFLVSDNQLKYGTSIPLMVKNPNVKKRDKFYNKAHGPNWLHLYRYSKDKDFPAIIPRKKKGTT
jgi:uncharacterized protein YqfB (UPF0267 family)